MSKSKHNGVDPAEAIASFGVDTTRLIMLADAAPFSQRNWDPEGNQLNYFLFFPNVLLDSKKTKEFHCI